MSDICIQDKVIQLIELCRKKTYCSLDYLATNIGVSTRTIRNYIKQLNKDLSGIASIVNEKGKGCRLYIENQPLFNDLIEKSNTDKITLDSPQRRIAFIIEHLINEDETNTLEELAFDMNIGRTTLINDLKKAAVVLETYNLKILGKQNSGIYLSGDEINLRFFILDNVYDFIYHAYPLDEDIKYEIIEIAKKYDLESSTKNLLIKSVIVMLDRLIRNHGISSLDAKYNKLLDSKEYHIALEVAKSIEKRLPITIPETEVLFIALPFAGRRTPTNNRSMADITVTSDIKRLLSMIIEQVGFDMEIILNNKTFLTDLEYHLTFMTNRLMFDIRLKNPLLNDVKEKYPVAYKMAEIAGQVIEKEYGLIPSEDELGYLAFYFGIYIAENDIAMRKIDQVAVICGTGRGTAKLVAIQLKRILHHHTKIDMFSDSDISKDILKKYDIVFTTVTLPFKVDRPLIKVNEIFDENNVARQIEKVTYMKKFKIEDTGNYNSILNLLMNEDTFFVLNRKKSYQDNVNTMVDSLIEKNYLDIGFKERLLKREEKGSMVFDRFIALPHTMNHASEKIMLALGVFPESIYSDKKEIKLVFLLGIPSNEEYDASLLVKIYDEIIRMASDQEMIDRLVMTTSYGDLTKILEHESRLK
ncbi:BglG family transcription antiterminator [Heyndrickxia sporothermodurans]